jgi:hypothetical protein
MNDSDATVDEVGRCVLTELLPDECSCRFHATARPPSGRGRTGPRSDVWRRDDDMVVAAAYLEHGTNNLPAEDKARLAELVGCSVASVAYKLGNLHTYVSGQGALEVMEQLTYLLFMKGLDERQTLAEAKANRTDQPIEDPGFPDGTFTPEGFAEGRSYQDLRW